MQWERVLSGIALATLAACGGGGSGGSNSPDPSSPARMTLELVAGPVDEPAELASSPRRGCADGPAAQAVLGTQALTVGTQPHLLYTAERGQCDGRMRIRQVDTAARTITTLVQGAPVPAASEPGPFQLTSFLAPTALAQAADGALLIADSEVFTGGVTLSERDRPGLGNGIWSWLPGAQPRQLAGFQTATPSFPAEAMKDGTGAQAVFVSVTALCAGRQGESYVKDLHQVRRVSAAGAVTTLDSTAGSYGPSLACGREGRSLATVQQADGQRRAYALPSGPVLPASLGNTRLLAQNGDRTAWATTEDQSKLFLLDLDSGEALPGSTVTLSPGAQLQVQGRTYTAQPGQLQAAGEGVAYMPTAYGIVRLSYR